MPSNTVGLVSALPTSSSAAEMNGIGHLASPSACHTQTRSPAVQCLPTPLLLGTQAFMAGLVNTNLISFGRKEMASVTVDQLTDRMIARLEKHREALLEFLPKFQDFHNGNGILELVRVTFAELQSSLSYRLFNGALLPPLCRGFPDLVGCSWTGRLGHSRIILHAPPPPCVGGGKSHAAILCQAGSATDLLNIPVILMTDVLCASVHHSSCKALIMRSVM